MWKYEKKLEYPVNITHKDLKMAKAMFKIFKSKIYNAR